MMHFSQFCKEQQIFIQFFLEERLQQADKYQYFGIKDKVTQVGFSPRS